MKKIKLFNLGLFKEGIKQLKLIGILATTVFTIEAVWILFGRLVNFSSNDLDFTQSIRFIDIHPIIYAAYILMVPFMMMSLFGFMNKRNSSDFYHSLPHKRESVFFSFLAAVVTWVLIAVGVSSCVSLIIVMSFPKIFVINVASLVIIPNIIAASLLVAGAMSIAISISGTPAVNIMLTGLILFMPRVFISLLVNAIQDKIPFITSNTIPWIFTSNANFVTGGFSSIFSTNQDHAFWQTFAYTFVLALIYTVLGCLAFCARKSESAQMSAPNRILQNVYRITITMFFSILLCAGIYTDDIDFTLFVGGCIFIIVVYFSYELITTKKWKNLAKAAPQFLIVVAISAAILFTFYGIERAVVSYEPKADEIENITVVNDSEYRFFNVNYIDYIANVSNEIEITDKDIIKMVADRYEHNLNVYRNGNYRKYFYGDNIDNIRFETTTVKIKLNNGFEIARNIYFTPQENSLLMDASVYKCLDRGEKVILPKPNRNTLCLVGYGNVSLYYEEENMLIFEALKSELAEIDAFEWCKFYEQNSEKYSYFNLNYSVDSGINTYNLKIPIDSIYTPKTLQLIIDKKYENGYENIPTLYDKLNKIDLDKLANESEMLYIDISIIYPNESDGEVISEYFSIDSNDILKNNEYIDKFKRLIENPTPPTKDGIISLRYIYENYKEMYMEKADQIDIWIGFPENIDNYLWIFDEVK